VEEQRRGFLAWLQAPAEARDGTARRITLRLPRKVAGDKQGRVRWCRRHFTCTVLEGAEELPEAPTGNKPEARVARLDFHELKKQQQNNELSRPQSRPSNILIWVEMPSKRVLKSENAPTLMFQAGTCLSVVQEAARFSRRITVEMMLNNMGEMMEPSGLGTFTITSGGYQLHTEVTLLNSGESWEGTDRSWCLLCLSKICLSEIKSEGGVQL